MRLSKMVQIQKQTLLDKLEMKKMSFLSGLGARTLLLSFAQIKSMTRVFPHLSSPKQSDTGFEIGSGCSSNEPNRYRKQHDLSWHSISSDSPK